MTEKPLRHVLDHYAIYGKLGEAIWGARESARVSSQLCPTSPKSDFTLSFQSSLKQLLGDMASADLSTPHLMFGELFSLI